MKRCLIYSIKFKKQVIKTFIIWLHSFLPQRLDTEKEVERHLVHQNASISGWWNYFTKTFELFVIFNNENILPLKLVKALKLKNKHSDSTTTLLLINRKRILSERILRKDLAFISQGDTSKEYSMIWSWFISTYSCFASVFSNEMRMNSENTRELRIPRGCISQVAHASLFT